MVKDFNWTLERLDALSEGQIRELMINAERRDRQDIVEMCSAVLAKIAPTRAKRTNAPRRSSSGAKALADELAEEIGVFAVALAKRFDLSEETARRMSAGTKGFVAHKLVDSRGRAKTGGAEKTRKLQFDRLLSYRLKDCTITVSAFLLSGDDTERVRFEVIAPPDMLADGRSLDLSARKGLYLPRSGTQHYVFKECANLRDALEEYGNLVGKLQQEFAIKPL